MRRYSAAFELSVQSPSAAVRVRRLPYTKLRWIWRYTATRMTVAGKQDGVRSVLRANRDADADTGERTSRPCGSRKDTSHHLEDQRMEEERYSLRVSRPRTASREQVLYRRSGFERRAGPDVRGNRRGARARPGRVYPVCTVVLQWTTMS